MVKLSPVTQEPAQANDGSTTNILFRLVLDHYSHNKANPRNKSQLSSEKWLFPLCNAVLFNRWMCIPAAVVIQFCCGSLYAFSVLNKPIELYIFGEIRNIAPITFYMTCGSMGLSCGLMGPWVERNGPRVACLVGTSLFCFGHLLTALAVYYHQIYLVFLFYGVMGGYGSGICYITPISALQKWFPDRRGMASGFAICGFGSGAIVIAKVQIVLIDYFELPMAFVILGLAYLIAMTLATLVLRSPPPDFIVSSATEKPNGQSSNQRDDAAGTGTETDKLSSGQMALNSNMTLLEALTSKDFRLIYVAFIASVIFGLCAMSRLSNMVTDIFLKDPDIASTAVSVNGGFNLGGRLGFALISDYLGRKNCFVMMLTIQLVMVVLFSVATVNVAYNAFVASIWISTACNGGISAVVPALMTDRFGAENVGACVGIQMTGWSLAAVAGGLIYTAVFDVILDSGYTTKDPFPYNVNSWWILVIVCIGWICLLFLKPTDKDLKFWRNCKRILRGESCCQSNRVV